MFKLYGKKQRCRWCGRANKENYKEIIMTIRQAKPPQEKAIVCSEECEKKVFDTCRSIERNIPLFLAGSVLGSIMAVSGIFIPLIGKSALPVSIIGVLILGMTFAIFPFVTPQTVKIFGLRSGMLTGRIGGILLLLLGVILLGVIFIFK